MESQGTGDPIRNLDGYGNQGIRESSGRGNGSNNNFHNVYSHRSKENPPDLVSRF